ncbi:MAG: hypothetical protein WCL08_14215 [Verrucomicrobiota bacterium]
MLRPALRVAVVVETGHHKSSGVVFHSGGCCGLNLLEGLTSYNSQHVKWMFHAGTAAEWLECRRDGRIVMR